MRPSISICIIAYQSEETLPRTLASAAWADEVLVLVDAKSTDATEAVARAAATRVEVHPSRGDIATKRECVSWATGDWVMLLDADEVISEELQQSLIDALERAPAERGGFEVNRLTYHLGRWIRHGDFYPDWILRVFRRKGSRIVGDDPHARIEVTGSVARLAGHVEHYSYRDLADQIERIQSYSEVALEGIEARRPRARVRDMVLRPPARFLRAYLLKRGFLDGVPGFIIAAATAFHVFLKYAKHWEKQRVSKET